MKVIVNGAAGRMGVEVLKFVNDGYRGAELAAAVDREAQDGILGSLSEFDGNADVLIDFSHHAATPALLEYAKEKRLPVVICTTGHTCDEIEEIREASKFIPVFHSGNMSVGVAVLVRLAADAAAAFPEADIEIVETHHNRKLDAPSGTALMIADGIRNVRPDAYNNCGRAGNGKREPKEIGISAVRRGNIVGIHEVLISTDTQTLTLKHGAHSRSLFAEGAIAAADFLVNMPAGLYNMEDMLAKVSEARKK